MASTNGKAEQLQLTGAALVSEFFGGWWQLALAQHPAAMELVHHVPPEALGVRLPGRPAGQERGHV
jgi:hypothetical protein